ncbi:dihydropteroate synthase [Nocardioides sp. Root1257]|uniref:dihydropteroate synthase n=1 Tax=unclassified Nocardioides TaxID=2615069 RepID=UPI0006F533CB|nr:MULTISPECIES: dihydropteroate synthase [unclassified Nocardioides]KQW46095.1 dihydropteroate synthase [Nocardioides sp. Root1257]KRC43395.1 dihydropteroate synthase [Nocardioides sp. Root224]
MLNVTPDSFSDGGKHLDHDVAVARGHQMVAEGADVVDIGGESTRPGARRTTLEVEIARVMPVVHRLVADGVVVSVDTMRAHVAAAAIDAGARFVNDVSGGAADPAMLPLLAATGQHCVLMHWRGHSEGMSTKAHYRDVLAEVTLELERCVDRAVAAGIATERIIVDPGLGFAKDSRHNWEVLGGLHRLRTSLGLPVLVGASRKRFLTEMVGGADASLQDRDTATASVSALVAAAGCWGVRVHDVRASSIAVHVGRRMSSSTGGLATVP